MQAALGPKEDVVWPSARDDKCVTIVKTLHVNNPRPKETLLFDGTSCQYLIIALRVPLTVNFFIRRLGIDAVLGILFMSCFSSKSMLVYFVLYTVFVATTTNVSTQVSNILMLSRTNFKVWKETAEIILGCMDFHLAVRSYRPTTASKNLNDVKIEHWDLSNRMCMIIMKHSNCGDCPRLYACLFCSL